MPPNFKNVHRVNIVFHPEGDEKFMTEQIISFSSEKSAREFAERQKKKSTVFSAKYVGGDK